MNSSWLNSYFEGEIDKSCTFYRWNTTSKYIANVPKLKGMQNYDEWSFENLLLLKSMNEYIKSIAVYEINSVDDCIDTVLYVYI